MYFLKFHLLTLLTHLITDLSMNLSKTKMFMIDHLVHMTSSVGARITCAFLYGSKEILCHAGTELANYAPPPRLEIRNGMTDCYMLPAAAKLHASASYIGDARSVFVDTASIPCPKWIGFHWQHTSGQLHRQRLIYWRSNLLGRKIDNAK